MTLIYFIKQPLRSHNCKHSEPLFLLKLLQVRAGRLLTSYSFSPGAGIATLALSAKANIPCSTTPSRRQALVLGPAQAEAGVLPSHRSSAGQLTLSQFHTQTG